MYKATLTFVIQDDWTPLIYASREGHVAVVNKLLQHNADVSFCREVVYTALLYFLYVMDRLRHHETIWYMNHYVTIIYIEHYKEKEIRKKI